MGVEIIAETSLAHEGSLDRAMLFARAAGGAGADAVKYQMIIADELATPDYPYFGTYRQCEMAGEAWRQLKGFVQAAGLRFYADIFGDQSLDMAGQVKADGVKLHSSDLLNLGLVRRAACRFERLYLHCGGTAVEELEEVVSICEGAGRSPCLLVGFQATPTPIEENRLRRIPALRERFPNCRIGFMDHTDGAHLLEGRLGLVALGLGADCIEKHLTLDRTLKLVDFVSALSPERFRAFCAEVREAERALGDSGLALTPVERQYAITYRKRVVAGADLPAGTELGYEHLTTKRVGGMEKRPDLYDRLDRVVGRVLLKDVARNTPITRKDTEVAE